MMPNVEMTATDCWCGMPFSMPTRLYKSCKKSGTTFYCPLGHKIVFTETDADKYRRERDRLQQQLAREQDATRQERERTEAAERSAAAYKGQVTKIKKRVGHGVCPCCNRTFQNLARHMENKHPDYTDNVVPLAESVSVTQTEAAQQEQEHDQ